MPNGGENDSRSTESNDSRKQDEERLNPYRNPGDVTKEWHRRLDMVDDSPENGNENVDDKSNEDNISKSQQFAFDQAENSNQKYAASTSTKRKGGRGSRQ